MIIKILVDKFSTGVLMSIKSKQMLVACAMVVSTASCASSSVCSDPLDRICKSTADQRLERDKYVQKLKQEISNEANKNAAPRIAEMKKKISGFHFIKRMIQTFKITNQEIMKSAEARIGSVETVVTNPDNVKRLKGLMAKSIDQSNFDDATKANFKSIEDSVVIGNFHDFIEKTGLEDNVLAQLLGSACGTDGLVDNAFATELNGQRYVLVCPGFLITLSQSADDTERFNSILHAISHEMGHHIDNSKVGDALYAPYLNCLSNNYADQFKRSKDDDKYCNAKDRKIEDCNKQVVASHSHELIADQWGIRSTNIYMREQLYSAADADQLLTDSWAKLCGTGDEGIHPTGDFRIGTLLRTNPDITTYLGCNNSSNSNLDSKPACTFSGESKI